MNILLNIFCAPKKKIFRGNCSFKESVLCFEIITKSIYFEEIFNWNSSSGNLSMHSITIYAPPDFLAASFLVLRGSDLHQNNTRTVSGGLWNWSAAVGIPDLCLPQAEPADPALEARLQWAVLLLLLFSSCCRQTVYSLGDAGMLAELSLRDQINLDESALSFSCMEG